MISYICCVWNELNRAPVELNKLLSQLEHSTENYEILIIDNYSTDGTREWISEFQGKNVVKILNDCNIGKGGSIRVGIQQARGDICVIFDLDGEYLSSDAIVGVALMQQDANTTLALASRTLNGSKEYVYLMNYVGVRLITKIINLLYSCRLTDTATGLKILRRSFYIDNMPIFSGFNVDFELVCIALSKHTSVVEYSGSYFPRSKSEGKKIKAIRDGFMSLISIIYTYFRL